MFQITGILKEITPAITGTNSQGQPWQRCEVIVEAQEGEYISTYVFSVFNKDITTPVGSTVVVDFYVKSSNYNGKWFTNLNLYKMELGLQQMTYQPPMQQQYSPQGYQQPMQQQPYRQPLPQAPTQPIRPTPTPPQYTTHQQPQMPPQPAEQHTQGSTEDVADLPF